MKHTKNTEKNYPNCQNIQDGKVYERPGLQNSLRTEKKTVPKNHPAGYADLWFQIKGDADDFSDFDVFIQTETVDRETKETIKDTAWKAGIENMAVISPLIFSRYDLTDSPLRYSPVVENIMKEGIRI